MEDLDASASAASCAASTAARSGAQKATWSSRGLGTRGRAEPEAGSAFGARKPHDEVVAVGEPHGLSEADRSEHLHVEHERGFHIRHL